MTVNRIQYGKFFFTEDTEPALMDFINRANEGWEDFTGYHSGNDLKHSIYIGRTTGSQPIPLAIARRDSTGGCGLVTCEKSIKCYYLK